MWPLYSSLLRFIYPGGAAGLLPSQTQPQTHCQPPHWTPDFLIIADVFSLNLLDWRTPRWQRLFLPVTLQPDCWFWPGRRLENHTIPTLCPNLGRTNCLTPLTLTVPLLDWQRIGRTDLDGAFPCSVELPPTYGNSPTGRTSPSFPNRRTWFPAHTCVYLTCRRRSRNCRLVIVPNPTCACVPSQALLFCMPPRHDGGQGLNVCIPVGWLCVPFLNNTRTAGTVPFPLTFYSRT